MKSKFTLVEILGVTALITLLAAIGFAGYGYAMNSIRESSTRALIHSLEIAIETAHAKSSYIPVEKDNFVTIKVKLNVNGTVDELSFGSDDLKKSDAKACQKKFADEFLKVIDLENLKKYLNKDDTICDSWGKEIRYKYFGTFNEDGMDLLSAGADGGFGVDKAESPVTDKDKYFDKTSGEALCDDIMNFK